MKIIVVSIALSVVLFSFYSIIVQLWIQFPTEALGISNNLAAENTDITSLTQQQRQVQLLKYQNPTLGISLQYPSDWQIIQEPNDKLMLIKQKGLVAVEINVQDLDQSDITLSDYALRRVSELQTQRPDFQLVGIEPTIISNDIPAQKVVYSFEREEDGKTNSVMRIWSINESKLYTLAYIAESSQYIEYLPMFQKIVDSFSIDATSFSSGTSSIQVQSSDMNRDDNNEKPSSSLTLEN